jgi:hypothetical protein
VKILEIITEGRSGKVIVVGDSLAVGTGSQIPGAVVDAKVGISSSAVLAKASSNKELKDADLAIVSAGANDYPQANGGKNKNPQATISNIQSIRNALGAKKYVWILPFNRNAAKDISSAVGGDDTVDLASVATPGPDGLHPSSYAPVAKAAMSAGGNIKPKEDNKQDPSPAGTTSGSFVIAVPSGRRGAAVMDIQKALVALGFDIGPTGADGVRGPYTSAAVKQLQTQLGVTVDGDPGPETVAALNKMLATKPDVASKLTHAKDTDVKGPDYSSGAGKYADLANDENAQKAQKSCEKFLGRKIDSDEWNYLIRGIYAEATSNQKEIAYVAAVMLNRTRLGKWGNSIISVLRAPNQFQSVTGTRADGHSASKNFTQGPGAGSLGNIYKSLIDILPHAPTEILRFTAANRKAYGAGTNVGYLDTLLAQGGQQIGGTVFA